MAQFAPLPGGITRAEVDQGIGHPGLVLDKLGPFGVKNERLVLDGETHSKPRLELVCLASQQQSLRDQLERARSNRQVLFEEVRALPWTARTLGPLALHLSRAGAMENAGICLHPIHGFVMLPGSGLKGAARAFAELAWAPQQPDARKARATIDRIFGWSPRSDTAGKKQCRVDSTDVFIDADEGSAAGAVVFHEAWPTSWVPIQIDILNPHHARYYQADEHRVPPPGDWEDPIPVYFPSVGAGHEFEFAVSRRGGAGTSDEDLSLAQQWLGSALHLFGAGAKTASGYGTFAKPEKIEIVPLPEPRYASFETTLELVTPAFLAGASQTADDCELRPATVRGQLRWWWRTMHAAHVDPQTLRRMEALVWGDTERQGAVRIDLQPVSATTPQKYDKAGQAAERRLPRPPNQKTTQGLLYVSYGMDETKKTERIQRYFVAPGAHWTIRCTSTARAGAPGIASAGMLLDQARAALWLLCQFGGVGSKSRNGFGSLSAPGLDLDVDHCRALGREIRDALRVATHDAARAPRSPALEFVVRAEGVLIGGMATRWTDPWHALDEIGMAAQTFAKRYKHQEKKIALGLPRKIHGPRPSDRPAPLPLSTQVDRKEVSRFASPVHYHVDKAADRTMTVRALAFVTPDLPSEAESRAILGELMGEFEDSIRAAAAAKSPAGAISPTPAPARRRGITLVKGQRARGLLEPPVEGKKRKVVFDEAEPVRRGYIENTHDLPRDVETGQQIDVFVWMLPANMKDDLKLWFPTNENQSPPGYRSPEPRRSDDKGPPRGSTRGGGQGRGRP